MGQAGQTAGGSPGQLITAITKYIDQRNAKPTLFVATATVRQVLNKVGNAGRVDGALELRVAP